MIDLKPQIELHLATPARPNAILSVKQPEAPGVIAQGIISRIRRGGDPDRTFQDIAADGTGTQSVQSIREQSDQVSQRLDLIQRLQRALYIFRIGREVIKAETQRDFTDDEVRIIRQQESSRGTLIPSEEITTSIAEAYKIIEANFGPFTPEVAKLFQSNRVFLFRYDENRNYPMEFKDRIRGIDRIRAPSEAIRQENIHTRSDNTGGTVIRGITALNAIDEREMAHLAETIRTNLQRDGFGDYDVDANTIRRYIYTSKLVHEWIHVCDKFFNKLLTRELQEPATYFLQYKMMTANLTPQEKIVFDAININYFQGDAQAVTEITQDPWFVQQLGGIQHLTQIMRTGKATMREMELVVRMNLSNPFSNS